MLAKEAPCVQLQDVYDHQITVNKINQVGQHKIAQGEATKLSLQQHIESEKK